MCVNGGDHAWRRGVAGSRDYRSEVSRRGEGGGTRPGLTAVCMAAPTGRRHCGHRPIVTAHADRKRCPWRPLAGGAGDKGGYCGKVGSADYPRDWRPSRLTEQGGRTVNVYGGRRWEGRGAGDRGVDSRLVDGGGGGVDCRAHPPTPHMLCFTTCDGCSISHAPPPYFSPPVTSNIHVARCPLQTPIPLPLSAPLHTPVIIPDTWHPPLPPPPSHCVVRPPISYLIPTPTQTSNPSLYVNKLRVSYHTHKNKEII